MYSLIENKYIVAVLFLGFFSGCSQLIQMCYQLNLMRNTDALNFLLITQVAAELQTNSFDAP